MLSNFYKFAGVLVIASCGCASYHAKPLQLESFASDWRSAPLDVEAIDAFYSRLSTSTDSPQRVGFNADDGLSLKEAEAVALVLNPQLRRIRAEADVPLASAKEAGWWPDPQFQASVLAFANRGRPGGFELQGTRLNGVNAGGLESSPVGYRRDSGGDYVDDPMIVNVGLNLTIPVSGRLAVEQDLAWSQYSAAWRQIAVREWQLLTDLRSAWIEWSIVSQRLGVSRDYATRLEAVGDITNRLASVGEMKTTDARVLAIELAQIRATIQKLEIQQVQRRLVLLALLGMPPDSTIKLVLGEIPSIKLTTETEQLALLLANHPRILATRADYEVAEQSFRLEVRKQYPDLNLGPTYTFEEGLSRIGGAISLPLPLWNRNRQAIAEAEAERSAAMVRAEATVQAAVADLANARTNMRLAQERLDLINATLSPLVDSQLSETRTLLNLGEVEVLVLRDALRASLQTKLDILDATLDRATAANELQQMLKPQWVTTAMPREPKE